jgi:alpha-tubulin suppressor-like RCC1 family protein
MECGKLSYISSLIYSDQIITIKELQTPENKIIDISSGFLHTLSLCENGTVYSFGCNYYRQLGYDRKLLRTIINPLHITNLHNVIQISCGACHSIVLTKDGLVYAFGDNSVGQLGLGILQSTTYPTLIPKLKDIIQISTGFCHTLANDGKIYGFGSNLRGELGFFEQSIMSTTYKEFLPEIIIQIL